MPRLRFGLCAAALCLCSCHDPAGAAACDSPPVVFVHGLAQDGAIFAPAIAYLSAQGIPASCLHAVDLSPADGDNEHAAREQLGPFVESVLASANAARARNARRPLHKVYLVAHSMGALSARWYAAILHPERVAMLVTTSGANHGTNWQCDAPYGPGHRQMCPANAGSEQESPLQFRLNGGPGPDVDETPYGVGADAPGVRSIAADTVRSILYVTLRAAGDRYVDPPASLLLDGAGWPQLRIDEAFVRQTSPGNFELLGPSGHDELLSSPAALRWLLQVFQSANTGSS